MVVLLVLLVGLLVALLALLVVLVVVLLDVLLARGNPDGIQAVLLDITMRDSDGVEVCKELRRAGVTLPIIAMTGLTEEASMQQFSTAGFTRVMSKPFDKAKLSRALKDDINF